MEFLETTQILATAMVVIGLLGLPFQFKIKKILRDNGYTVYWLISPISELRNYVKLIKTEDKVKIKKELKITLWMATIPSVVALLIFVLIIVIVLNR